MQCNRGNNFSCDYLLSFRDVVYLSHTVDFDIASVNSKPLFVWKRRQTLKEICINLYKDNSNANS